MPALEAHRFGRFILAKRLAVGGMGEIYLASLKGPGGFEKLLVIKRVLESLAGKPGFVEMFLSEARVAAKLAHRNIAQIYEMGRADGHYYIAMEYVAGRSLSELIKRAVLRHERVPLSHTLDIVSQVASGLDYAHRAADTQGPLNLIHRDISPRNLLLSYSGEVKIIDFGIAKSRMSLEPTAAGVVKGKVGYMSPEQSTARKLDPRSDIFSLGVVLYELCTSSHPFLTDDPILTFDAIQRKEPLPMSDVASELAVVEPIIDRALAKDPRDRFADCGALQRELQKLLQSGAVPAAEKSLTDYLHELFANDMLEDAALAAEISSLSPAAALPPPDERPTEALSSVTPLVAVPATYASTPLPVRPAVATTLVVLILLGALSSVGFGKLGYRHGQTQAMSRALTPGPGPHPPLASLVTPMSTPAPIPVSMTAVEPTTAVAPTTSATLATDTTKPETGKKAGQRSARPTADAKPPAPSLGVLEITTEPSLTVWYQRQRQVGKVTLKTPTGEVVIGSGKSAASDPFKIRLSYRLTEGTVSFKLDSEPWAFVQDRIGAGLGRTPLALKPDAGSVTVQLKTPPPDERRLSLSFKLAL